MKIRNISLFAIAWAFPKKGSSDECRVIIGDTPTIGNGIIYF